VKKIESSSVERDDASLTKSEELPENTAQKAQEENEQNKMEIDAPGEESSENLGDKTPQATKIEPSGNQIKEVKETIADCVKKIESSSVEKDDASLTKSEVQPENIAQKEPEGNAQNKTEIDATSEELSKSTAQKAEDENEQQKMEIDATGEELTENTAQNAQGGNEQKKMEIDATSEESSENTGQKVRGENEQSKMEIDDNEEQIVEDAPIKTHPNNEIATKISPEAAVASDNPKDGNHPTSQMSKQKDAKKENTSDGDGFGAFGLLTKRPRKKKKKKSEKSKPLRISIPSHTPKEQMPAAKLVRGEKQHSKEDGIGIVDNCHALEDKFCFVGDIMEEEDPLSFYSDTHEEQDPDYVKFHLTRLKNRLGVELAKLQKDKKVDMKKIQTYVSAKWEERNDDLQRKTNKIRVEMTAKQTRQRNQLSEKHKRQIEADERKIEDGEKWLVEKQQLELQHRMNQHQALPNNIIEWNTVATQLQHRHKYQRQQFEEKKVEMKKRSEQELKAQNQILEAHHKKRQAEAETYIKEVVDKCHKQQENLKAKLSRLHEERFDKKEKEVRADCTLSLDGESHPGTLAQGKSNAQQMGLDAQQEQGFENTLELHVSHRTVKGGMHEGSVSHDAVIRQKQRKGLMNNAPIQLAIEIHNEGIIAMTRSNHQEGERRSSDNEITSGRSSTFIPWGAKARSILYSIVVGEIPSGYFLDQIGRAGRGALGGGLVKCMITDTRTSDDTAILERAETLAQVQVSKSKAHVEEIERSYTDSCAVMSTLQGDCTLLMEKEGKIATAHKEAALQFERAKQTLDKFKAQAQHFFNQDGTPSPRVNPDSQQKLLTAMHKYKSAYESSKSKEAALRQPLEIARNVLTHKKTDLQKIQHDAMILELSLKKARQTSTASKGKKDSNARDEEYTLETTIENITATLSKIAEKRRSQVSRSKSNSGYSDSWERSMSSVPEEKKKSFHQKMLRRRITTMLRPNVKTMLGDFKQKNFSRTNKDCFDICDSDEGICPELRAEQLLLLALHPQSPNIPLPPVPNQSAPSQGWAEPGWQLILDDPDFGKSSCSSSILPIDTEGHLSQNFLSSCCSSGRQAASLIKPRHLRMLSAPLSFICQASAPAEMNPSGTKKASQDIVDADPLSATDEKMLIGYSFIVRPPVEETKENPVIDVKSEVTEKTTKKRRASKKVEADPKGKSSTKRRRSQASKKQTSSTSPANDPGFNAQAVSQNQPILPPFPNNTMPNQNQQMNIDHRQADQYRLLNQTNFQQQQHQQQQQQQFQHMLQMRQLQAQLQLQQQQQQQSSNPSQIQQMQFMPSQRPQDQQMPFPQQFNQQMNQMVQQNPMGNGPIQHQQAGSNPASANQQLNRN